MQFSLLKKHKQPAAHAQPQPVQPARPAMAPAGGGFPLVVARCGTPVQVNKVRGADDTVRFLESLGLVENSSVTVVCENGGNLIVDVKGSRVALSRQMASKITVRE